MIDRRTSAAPRVESARRPPDAPTPYPGRRQLAARLGSLIRSFVIGAVIPIATYFLVRPHVRSDTIALAIGGGIAAAWTLAHVAWRRRIDPVGAIAVLGFAAELCVAALTGGNALALKLELAPLTGALGVVCLVSAAVRRPLIPLVLRRIGRGGAAARQPIATTVAIGGILVTHAATHVVMAAALPTSTFLKVSRGVNWAVLGAGIALLLWMTRKGDPDE